MNTTEIQVNGSNYKVKDLEAQNAIDKVTAILKGNNIGYGANTNSAYYKKIPMLSTQDCYIIGITVETSGNYTVQVGTDMQTSSMVDTIYEGTLTAYKQKLIWLYTPSVSGCEYIRLSSNSVNWYVTVYAAKPLDVDTFYTYTENKRTDQMLEAENATIKGFGVSSGKLIASENQKCVQLFVGTNKTLCISRENKFGIYFTSFFTDGEFVDNMTAYTVTAKTSATNWNNGQYYTISSGSHPYLGILFYDSLNEVSGASMEELLSVIKVQLGTTPTEGTEYYEKVYKYAKFPDEYFAAINEKQETLVSGANIKTINGFDVLGSGDLPISGGGGSGGDAKIAYVPSVTVKVGDELISGNFTLGTGWSGDATNGYTHTTGNTALMTKDVNAENGSLYLLEFDTSVTTVNFVSVGFGDIARELAYNGTSHIVVPLKSDGGLLKIEPSTAFSGTLSNISLKKIQSEGTDKVISIYSVLTDNHTQNFGFWNVLLGKNNAENAVPITRTIAIGYSAMQKMQAGNRNVVLGPFACSEMLSGENNIALGADCLFMVQNGHDNVALGMGAMRNGNGHEYNIALGSSTLKGSEGNPLYGNVAIGKDAMINYLTGNLNVVIGADAGASMQTGNSNVVVGRGADCNGGSNTIVGPAAKVTSGYSQSVAIGHNAQATKSNQMVLGGTGITEVVMCGNKKIIFNQDGTVTWTTIS